MIWRDLLWEIDSSTFINLQEKDIFAAYSSASWLPPKGQGFAEDVLWIATGEMLDAAEPQENISLIVLLSSFHESDSLNTWRPCCKNGIVFSSTRDFRIALDAIFRAFRQAQEMDRLQQTLTALLGSGQGLSAAVETLADYFQAPVNIVDNSFSYLASSLRWKPRSKTLFAETNAGFVVPAAAKMTQNAIFKSHGNTIGMHNSNDCLGTLRVLDILELRQPPAAGETFLNYVTPIVSGAVPIGALSIVHEDNQRLSPTELGYLPQLASLLGLEMQKSDFFKVNKATYYSHLFSKILSGESMSNEDMETRLTIFGYQLKPLRYILAVQPDETQHQGAELNSIGEALSMFLKNSVYLVQNDLLIFLHSRDITDPITLEIASEWNTYMLQYGYSAGVSSGFANLANCKNVLEQATAALETGKAHFPSQAVFLYDRLRPTHIASVLSHAAPYQLFCLHEILCLVEYDEENGTQLSQLLYLYLHHPKEPAQVYERLHIHKNTFYLRLEKIQTIIHADLNDGIFMMLANLSFLLLREQHRINWEI